MSQNISFESQLQALRAMLRERGESENQFRPARQEALAWLAASGFPQSVRDFYAQAEPVTDIESEGVYLLPLARIMDANTNVIPGAISSQHGYFVIANTVSGDAYCLQVDPAHTAEQSPIYLANHEQLGAAVSLDVLQANMLLAADSFPAFLDQFAAGALPYDFYLARDEIT